MKGMLWKIIVASLAVVAAIGCAVVFSSENIETKVEGSNMFGLIKPPFVSAAEEGTNFLEEEAGISAYANVGEEIDLDDAKTGFRTIEKETNEYIIGSVALPGYAETEDVHCYIHKDGWVVAYYLKDEPVAKIIDWNSYGGAAITSTQLTNGIAEICNVAGVPTGSPKYYDFRYPNADKLMIAADAQFGKGTDTFRLKIPSDFLVYERSWSHYVYTTLYTGHKSTMKIDGNIVSEIGYKIPSHSSATDYGQLAPSDFNAGVFHTISIYNSSSYLEKGFVAIALIYREG